MSGLKEEAAYLLRQLEASARKKLGQNFMVDEAALEFIANALDLKKDEPVIEIGPGLGFLTRFLLSHGGAVTAVEKDHAYAAFLAQFYKNKKFKAVEADVLKTRISDLLPTAPVKVCGNIPYNITSPILEWLIDQRAIVSDAVLTVQWEVAERLGASPGTREWGSLSVFLQYHADVRVLRKVGKASFSPAPKVDSAVIHLRFRHAPACAVKDEELFFRLVRRSFQKRRKTVLNALTDDSDGRLSKPNVEKALRGSGIDPVRRAETLSLPEWARLADSI